MSDDPLAPLAGRDFALMDGAGNDFVIVDLRRGGDITPEAAQHLADRDGIFGGDQIIGLVAGPKMLIWNADGSEAGACGNAARCVADWLLRETGTDSVEFDSPSGMLRAARKGGMIEVDMGAPRLEWDEIPIAEECADTTALPLPTDVLNKWQVIAPVGVSMGNPHAIFFVDDAEALELEKFGAEVEVHPMFPDRVNVTLASKADAGFRTRTFERGVGITKACGTAACATLVAAVRIGQAVRSSLIHADGGTLMIRWDEDTNHVFLAGPTKLHERGVL
ncbi:MAG: diaminopimelate epimerase [Parvularculaceae bacterium]|nr:diaminopimelate epimerase [Parvularculaceae bacterium]